ncbi:hypothetical protein STEG23_026157, partial [Scotinomys teguina]
MAPSTSTPKSPPPLGDEEEDEESPVTEPPIGQSYQKLSFCFIEHLKSACASYGPTAPFTLALWRTKAIWCKGEILPRQSPQDSLFSNKTPWMNLAF